MSVQIPKPIQRRCDQFEAIASNLVATARENPDAPALAQRFLQAAKALEDAVKLIKLANWAARLNLETAASMAAARRAP